ncbi:MAG TPA: SHOCT domain-containing protein [Rariglobus sp.]
MGEPGGGHDGSRALLRGLGFVLVAVGGIFSLVGLVDFFSAFGSMRPPTLFWCLFVGFPAIGFGLMLLKMGYLGAVSRYVAEETVPVVRDSVVDVAEGLGPAIRDIAADLRGSGREVVSADPAARLARVDKLRADGLISEAEHAEQRARILREL